MSDGLQRRVQETIDQLVESGAERGLQVAVYRDGELLVDAFQPHPGKGVR